MKHIFLALTVLLGSIGFAYAQGGEPTRDDTDAVVPDRVDPNTAAELGCLSCHEGIESIHDPESEMMQQIVSIGLDFSDPGGCVTCHGGNPQGLTADEAHDGAPAEMAEFGPDMFFADPGSVWIAEKTCGQCHSGYEDRLELSLMNTEAGKLQGNLWSWA